MKRIFRCLLALLTVLAMTAGWYAYAAGTLTVTTVSGKTGEQVSVEVCLTGDDVCSGGFDVRFDSSKLTLLSAQKGNGSWFGAVNEKEDGLVRVSFAQTTPITDAVLCRLNFRVTAATPAAGTPILIENALLYNENSDFVETSLVFGSISRDCVWITLENAETVEGQGVRAEISMTGTQQPCGGNFTVNYDPAVLTAVTVLPLSGLESSQLTYNISEHGVVRIAFAGEQPVADGALCAVVFQAIGSAGSATDISLSDVRTFDENSDPMDTEVTNGAVSVVIPTESDPKLWVVGGAMDEHGSATASVVLQGRGVVCGGQCTLLYDPSMQPAFETKSGVVCNSDEPGKLNISWAQESPETAAAAVDLLTVTFASAVESKLTFDSNVNLFDEDSKQIGSVDIRSGAVTAVSSPVTVTVDQVSVKSGEDKSSVTIDVDLADVTYFTDEPVEQATAMLALYCDNMLVGIDVADSTQLGSGVAEISLSASCGRRITDYAVFVVGDSSRPISSVLRGN